MEFVIMLFNMTIRLFVSVLGYAGLFLGLGK